MAGGESGESSALGAGRGSGLPLILGLVLANLLTRTPIESLRPEAEGLAWTPVGRMESLPARLWEDPLSVSYDAHARNLEGQGGSHSPLDAADLGDQLRRLAPKAAGGAPLPLILPVLVRGGSWLENHEKRLRSRYAVIVGLASRGYFPKDDQHLGYCSIPSFEPGASDKGASHKIVPFEWFEGPRSDDSRAALVLWIDESSLGQHPLLELESILRELDPHDLGLEVTILGPTNSTSLMNMLRDDKWFGHKTRDAIVEHLRSSRWIPSQIEVAVPGPLMGSPRLEGARLLSAWSTMRFKSAGPDGLDPAQEWRTNIRFERFIGTDDELVQILMNELRLRVPALGARGASPLDSFLRGTLMLRDESEPARILLVSEADTSYGRAFKREFARKGELEIHELRYLRGVDGKVPGDGEPSSKSKTGAGELAADESATGESQLDYVRRLERGLTERSTQYDAIGVLGSDLYDKLTIIKVLRKTFPDAVMFTTDMDARLLPTELSPETLNLLVASHYGLTLPAVPDDEEEAERRRGLPPFRSGYQSALCLAAMAAVSEEGRVESGSQPTLYEIGRHGAHALGQGASPPQARGGSGSALSLWIGERAPIAALLVLALLSLAPVRVGLRRMALRLRRRYRWLGWIRARHAGLFVLILAASMLLWGLRPSLVPTANGGGPGAAPWDEGLAIGAVALMVLILFLLALLHPVRATIAEGLGAAYQRLGATGTLAGGTFLILLILSVLRFIKAQATSPTGEPFALFAGISIWPTEILRLAVAVFCSIAVLGIWSGWKLRQDQIEEACKLRPAPSVRALQARLGRWGIWRDRTRAPATSISELWLDYRAETMFWPRMARVLACTTVYYVLSGLMFGKLGTPGVPSRGWDAFLMDRLMLFLSVTGMIFLIFVVVDATLSTARFLRRMDRLRRERPHGWWEDHPDPSSAAYGLPATEATEILGVELIERTTDAISSFLYYPAVALFMMLFSRSRLFDNWTWSTALVLTFVLCFGLLLLTAQYVGSLAKEIRRNAIRRLEDQRTRSHGSADRLAELDAAAAVILRTRGGAYAKMREHPMVRVILLPFAGLGAASLMEFFFPLWMQL